MVCQYEIGFVISPDASEEEVHKIIGSITGPITKADGKIDKIDEWGRRKLAFPVEKNTEGYYVFIQTEVDGGIVSSLERRLRQTERVMRFLVLRLDDKLKKTHKLTKRWSKLDQIRKRVPGPSEEEEESEDEELTNGEEKNHAE